MQTFKHFMEIHYNTPTFDSIFPLKAAYDEIEETGFTDLEKIKTFCSLWSAPIMELKNHVTTRAKEIHENLSFRLRRVLSELIFALGLFETNTNRLNNPNDIRDWHRLIQYFIERLTSENRYWKNVPVEFPELAPEIQKFEQYCKETVPLLENIATHIG
jgi:hypothetical protein